MEVEDRLLLQHVATRVAAIDERTAMTHELVTAHIERSDLVHDQLHSRVSRLARTVHIGGGGLSLVVALGVAWLKGLFEPGS